jgi:hypothetical protein
MGSPYFASIGYASPLTLAVEPQTPGFPWASGHELAPGQPPPGGTTLLRHPIACLLPDRVPRSPEPHPRKGRTGSDGQHHRPRHGRTITSTGISTRYPSTTPVGLALGPGSPWADKPGPGTLGHPAAEILTLHSLLMPAFSLPHPPRHPHRAASPDAGRSPTQPIHDRPPRLRRCA